MHEEWKPIQGYEGLYEVSNLGRVRSLKRETYVPAWGRTKYIAPRILTNTWIERSGYRVKLYKHGMPDNPRVARLVAEAFLRPVGMKMHDMIVIHKDQNRRNIKASNLAWVNRTTWSPPAPWNAQEAAAKLTKKQVKEIRRRLRDGWTGVKLAEVFKVCPSTITKIKKFKSWKDVRI